MVGCESDCSAFFVMSSTQIDPRAKSNIDRLERRKMNSLRRVQSLPSRGGAGDWVVVEESRMQNGEKVKVDVTYAWVEGSWTAIGISAAQADVEVPYSYEFGQS